MSIHLKLWKDDEVVTTDEYTYVQAKQLRDAGRDLVLNGRTITADEIAHIEAVVSA
jgi:hypothetical protein